MRGSNKEDAVDFARLNADRAVQEVIRYSSRIQDPFQIPLSFQDKSMDPAKKKKMLEILKEQQLLSRKHTKVTCIPCIKYVIKHSLL